MSGLAPQSRRGLSAAEALTPIEDMLVLGPIRKARADCLARAAPNMPGVAMCDLLLPLVAEGLLAILRMQRDGLDIDTGPAEFKVSTPMGMTR